VVAQNVDAADLAITAKGGIYYTDPARKTVGRVNGKVYPVPEIAMPSGIALSPDQAMLIVTDAQSRFSWSFQIAPDGSLINGEPFYRLEMPESGWMSAVHSVTEDAIGQVYFASAVGIQICEANGRVAQILNAPAYGPVTALAFAGPEMNWLYAADSGKLYRRPVKVNGVPAWVLAKLPKPPL
jgi:sugar lactone lactonase YvrE